MNRTRIARSHGFTVVEILVVVGLLALLTALLLPAISRVRESGRARACTSNMQQLAQAFRQYAEDNGGRFPKAANFQSWGLNKGHWVTGPVDPSIGLATQTAPFTYQTGKSAFVEGGVIYPYVKTAGVYVCPSVPDGEKKRLSYSMNCAISGMSDLRIKFPSNIVLLVDEWKSLNDGFFWAVDNGDSTDTLNMVHNGGGNLLFADGHLKWYPFEAMTLDNSATGRANKSSTTNPVRFHERAFGPNNSYKAPGEPTNTCFE